MSKGNTPKHVQKTVAVIKIVKIILNWLKLYHKGNENIFVGYTDSSKGLFVTSTKETQKDFQSYFSGFFFQNLNLEKILIVHHTLIVLME